MDPRFLLTLKQPIQLADELLCRQKGDYQDCSAHWHRLVQLMGHELQHWTSFLRLLLRSNLSTRFACVAQYVWYVLEYGDATHFHALCEDDTLKDVVRQYAYEFITQLQNNYATKSEDSAPPIDYSKHYSSHAYQRILQFKSKLPATIQLAKSRGEQGFDESVPTICALVLDASETDSATKETLMVHLFEKHSAQLKVLLDDPVCSSRRIQEWYTYLSKYSWSLEGLAKECTVDSKLVLVLVSVAFKYFDVAMAHRTFDLIGECAKKAIKESLSMQRAHVEVCEPSRLKEYSHALSVYESKIPSRFVSDEDKEPKKRINSDEKPVRKKRIDDNEKPARKKKSHSDDDDNEKPARKKKVDSDDGDNEKPARKKKRTDSDDNEKPARKKKVDSDDDEKPARKKKVEEQHRKKRRREESDDE